eukprot:scaffold114_cov361-Pinguiococcus_pyrenoidosus.AAC.12
MHRQLANGECIAGFQQNDPREYLTKLPPAAVQRQVEAIEARVGPRPRRVPSVYAAELKGFPQASVSLQLPEPADGDARGARDELQQPCALLVVEVLENLEEPPGHLVSRAELPFVHRVRAPVRHVDLVDAGDGQLELLEVEDGQQSQGHHLVDAAKELVQRLADAVEHLVLEHLLDVLALVLIGHGLVPSVRDQLELDDRAGLGVGLRDGEVQAEVLHAIVVQDPLQALEGTSITELQVAEAERQPQDVLVQRPDEVDVDVHLVENGFAKESAGEPEGVELERLVALVGVALRDDLRVLPVLQSGEAIQLVRDVVRGRIREEHRVVCHLVGASFEEVAEHATHVHALLAGESDADELAELFLLQHEKGFLGRGVELVAAQRQRHGLVGLQLRRQRQHSSRGEVIAGHFLREAAQVLGVLQEGRAVHPRDRPVRIELPQPLLVDARGRRSVLLVNVGPTLGLRRGLLFSLVLIHEDVRKAMHQAHDAIAAGLANHIPQPLPLPLCWQSALAGIPVKRCRGGRRGRRLSGDVAGLDVYGDMTLQGLGPRWPWKAVGRKLL